MSFAIRSTSLVLSFVFLVGCGQPAESRSPAATPGAQSPAQEISRLQAQKPSLAADAAWVRVLNSGADAGQARIDLIQRAKRSITAQYFIYYDDETSIVSLALLRDAARRGVRVRIIVDALFNGIPKSLRRFLQLEGIEVREYHPLKITKLTQVVKRMHDKVLIIDENEMITGGRNIQNDYYNIPGNYQYVDRDVYVQGPMVVRQAVEHFETMWESKAVRPAPLGMFTEEWLEGSCDRYANKKDRDICEMRQRVIKKKYARDIGALNESLKFLSGEFGFVAESGRDWAAEGDPVSGIRFVHDNPGAKSEKTGIGPEILALLNSAKTSILIETPYLVPHKDEMEALRAAIARGVEVRILTNSAYSGDNLPVLVSYYKSEQRDILSLGVKVWEYKGPESIHAKTFVIDGVRTFIGSLNFDRMSYKYNTEVGVIFDDIEVAEKVTEDVEARMSEAWEIGSDGRPVDLEDGVKYPFPKGKSPVKRFVLRLFMRFIKPIL